MAKQLGEVRMLVFGDGTGPTRVRFEYCVSSTDDASLIKYAGLDVVVSDFDVDTIKDFFDAQVTIIKTNESIS
jgi:hypothetical protein